MSKRKKQMFVVVLRNPATDLYYAYSRKTKAGAEKAAASAVENNPLELIAILPVKVGGMKDGPVHKSPRK